MVLMRSSPIRRQPAYVSYRDGEDPKDVLWYAQQHDEVVVVVVAVPPPFPFPLVFVWFWLLPMVFGVVSKRDERKEGIRQSSVRRRAGGLKFKFQHLKFGITPFLSAFWVCFVVSPRYAKQGEKSTSKDYSFQSQQQTKAPPNFNSGSKVNSQTEAAAAAASATGFACSAPSAAERNSPGEDDDATAAAAVDEATAAAAETVGTAKVAAAAASATLG